MAARRDGASTLAILRGGDRRSIGRAGEVVALVTRKPALFAVLIRGMTGGGPYADDPCVRMRCADAAEKISARHPELLRPFPEALFRAAAAEQPEVRWHVAQMLPRLTLTARGQPRAVSILRAYLDDESRIVRACAIEGLARFAADGAALRPQVVPLLRGLLHDGSPAVRARTRRVLRWLDTYK